MFKVEKIINFKISLECIIYNKNKEILLLKRNNASYCNNMYALPAGHLESGETIIEGMIREIEEEIGIKYLEKDLSLVKVINRKIWNNDYIDFIFQTDLGNRVPINMETEKCSELIFRKLDNIPDNTIPLVKNILKNDVIYDVMEERND